MNQREAEATFESAWNGFLESRIEESANCIPDAEVEALIGVVDAAIAWAKGGPG